MSANDNPNYTNKTLLEQMRITELEISSRMALFMVTEKDTATLRKVQPIIRAHLDTLIDDFYVAQTSDPDIALLIGDADTLQRLKVAQLDYVISLFSGFYDLEYVNTRLRVGMVHKRIGVEPKLYLSAVQKLKLLIYRLIEKHIPDENEQSAVKLALEKVMMFDISLIFETYVRSLVSEVETSKAKSERYASLLEDKVKERTEQLEVLSRTDSLTGLLNRGHFEEMLTHELRAAQRREEQVTLAYIDLDDFKAINDSKGHHYGDEVLRTVSAALLSCSRASDSCFRFGGDEFCVVMPNCSIQQAKATWQGRLLAYVEEKRPCVSMSIGYSETGPVKFLPVEEILIQADEAMYRKKNKKKLIDPNRQVDQ
ncbi:GGDEF domain-containing protein [Salinibius halmophilus]|uniref:GGDEF domain-containing protein n=1 Tax=Salinibius halmophilus TaxID=1853216 RepID=UPI000E6653C3|nr:GGDEF domain-containing protein [Salinibius halmophilus]